MPLAEANGKEDIEFEKDFSPISFGVGGLLHDPLGVTAQRKNPVSLLRRLSGFFISSLRIQTAFDAQLEIKTPAVNATGFFLCRQEV